MEGSMFERVKREVGKSLFASGLFDGYAYQQVEGAIEAAARAAINAMEEPTAQMLDAGDDARDAANASYDDPWWIPDWLRARLPAIWKAMVAKALEITPAPTTDDPPEEGA